MASRKSNLFVLFLLAAGMVLAILAVWRAYEENYGIPQTPQLPAAPELKEPSEKAKRLAAEAGNLLNTDPARALDLLDSAIADGPDYCQAYLQKGHVLINEERFAEAESCFRRARELQPDDPRHHVYEALCLSRTGKEKAAGERLLYALAAYKVQFGPNPPAFHPVQAVIFYLMRRDELARKQLDAIVHADPNSAGAAYAERLQKAMDRLKDGDRWQVLRVE